MPVMVYPVPVLADDSAETDDPLRDDVPDHGAALDADAALDAAEVAPEELLEDVESSVGAQPSKAQEDETHINNALDFTKTSGTWGSGQGSMPEPPGACIRCVAGVRAVTQGLVELLRSHS